MRPPRRRWLVAVSLAAHLVLVLGLFVTGFWHLDRLEVARRRVHVVVAPPPPPAVAGGPALAATPTLVPKHHRRIVQVPKPTNPIPNETTPEVDVSPHPAGAGGSGMRSGAGSGTTDGACLDPPCGKAPQAPPLHAPAPTIVAPAVIRGLRISGVTQIQPPDPVQIQIFREGKTRITAAVKICLDTSGYVTSVAILKSSGYAAYDAELTRGVRIWRYRPYRIGDRAVPVCGVVTFVYVMRSP